MIPINKTRDDVRNDYLAKASDLQNEGLLPAELNMNRGLFRSFLELFSDGHTRLYEYLQNLLPQAFGNTASGDWLRTLHAPSVGITPIAKTKAKGSVVFARSGTTGNVNIPASRIVKTKPDGSGQIYRFVTSEAAVIADGSESVTVPVEAEEYGSAANVATGMISEIVTYIPGVDTVTNASDWLTDEGVDDESDTSLQTRYKLAWSSVNGATKYAYESWVRAVAGVADVRILDQHPRGQGTVDVVITGTGGIPTQGLIDEVTAKVETLRPINDDVLVYGATSVPVDVTAEIVLTGGTAAEVENAVETAIQTLIGTELLIGEDVTLDRITATIMQVSGYIKSVTISFPVADVTIDDDEQVTLNSTTITSTTAGI
jgi:uncharacterized phage protein gp47/JayE